MEFKDFVFALGDLFEWSFKILPILGNSVNYLFAILMFVGVIYWLRMSKQFSDDAERKGTLE